MSDVIKNSVTRVLGKKEFQSLLADAVKLGYIKEKLDHGYELRTPEPEDQLILKAMNGTKGYLCRFNSQVFA